MGIFIRFINDRSVNFVFLLGVICLAGTLHLSTKNAHCATIVLDPGHGGADTGAVSNHAYHEKQFTLTLAEKVAGRLNRRHRVQLTRSADFTLAPEDRAAVANYLRADVMISLHMAVPPYCDSRTAAVFYHRGEQMLIPENGETPSDLDNTGIHWSSLQLKHQSRSRALAETIKQTLAHSDAIDTITISGVPLVGLIGADVPAVMVEVGCLRPSIPPDIDTLEKQLDSYAEAIATAVETGMADLAR
jgi:N-acetylmuramoyl-L-alanine amidase